MISCSSSVSPPLIQVANIVVSMLTELLQAQVLVCNSQGSVIARSGFSVKAMPCSSGDNEIQVGDRALHLPLHIQDQVGEVIIQQLTDGEAISPRMAQAFIDLVVNQVANPNSFSDPQALKNQVIYTLLHGQQVDESRIVQQAKQLGLNLAPPRAVILIDATDFIHCELIDPKLAVLEQQRRSQHIINNIVSFFHLPNDTICADLGDGEFVVLKASDTKNMEPWVDDTLSSSESSSSSWTNLEALKRAGDALLMRLRTDTSAAISVGIGRYHPGLLGLSQSYQDARVALRLGRQFNGQNQVYCLDRLGIAAFACVADERTKVELAMHLLSPLDGEPDLLHTLTVFFEQGCSPSLTAKRLLIHRNTLSYRLEKIASLTGLDPRWFDDAIQIRLALLLRDLKPHHHSDHQPAISG